MSLTEIPVVRGVAIAHLEQKINAVLLYKIRKEKSIVQSGLPFSKAVSRRLTLSVVQGLATLRP